MKPDSKQSTATARASSTSTRYLGFCDSTCPAVIGHFSVYYGHHRYQRDLARYLEQVLADSRLGLARAHVPAKGVTRVRRGRRRCRRPGVRPGHRSRATGERQDLLTGCASRQRAVDLGVFDWSRLGTGTRGVIMGYGCRPRRGSDPTARGHLGVRRGKTGSPVRWSRSSGTSTTPSGPAPSAKARSPRPLPRRAIRSLNRRGIVNAICSNNDEDAARSVLDESDLPTSSCSPGWLDTEGPPGRPNHRRCRTPPRERLFIDDLHSTAARCATSRRASKPQGPRSATTRSRFRARRQGRSRTDQTRALPRLERKLADRARSDDG